MTKVKENSPLEYVIQTCYKRGITMRQLLGKTRIAYVVDVRQEIAIGLHKKFKMSIASIGLLLHRHESSVHNLLHR